MSTKPQMITVTLTRPQYEALADAVAARSAEFEGDLDEPGIKRQLTTLLRAWDRVRTAWHRSLDGF